MIPKDDPNYERVATEISSSVDSAIVIYESGDHETALLMLRNIGFRASDIHRLINHPDQRRQYINNIISGF